MIVTENGYPRCTMLRESEIISILAELVRIDMVSINEIMIIDINQYYHYFH